MQKQIFISKKYSYYKHLKLIINQSDLVAKEIILENGNSEYNGIIHLLPIISNKSVYLNKNTISVDNLDDYEIRVQTQEKEYDFENPAENEKILDLKYEHDHFSSIFEKQFINWWEDDIKDQINQKYNGLKNANSICQFARQIRNSFGHSSINVKIDNCVDPIWNGLNLKAYNGKDIYSLISIADLINFWIEFENEEL